MSHQQLKKFRERREARFAQAVIEHGTRDLAECQDCTWIGPATDMNDTQRMYERVLPGEELPDGECPNCGALAHRVNLR